MQIYCSVYLYIPYVHNIKIYYYNCWICDVIFIKYNKILIIIIYDIKTLIFKMKINVWNNNGWITT